MKNKSILMVTCLLMIPLSGCDLSKRKNAKNYETYKDSDGYEIILFGSYPQSRETWNSKLNNLAGTLPSPSNPHKWTPFNWSNSSSVNSSFAWYIDVDTDSDGKNDYRGVYFTSYYGENDFTKYVNLGFDRYTSEKTSSQKENGFETFKTHWFKYEPIKWRVLSSNIIDNFVMSNEILDSTPFSLVYSNDITEKIDYQGNHGLAYPNNYKYSNLRTFLNKDFYETAFDSDEKDKIKETKVDNSSNSAGFLPNEFACENTKDKIFALSFADTINPDYGFFNSFLTVDKARELEVSDYAACIGVPRGDSYEYFSPWMLRSPELYRSNYVETLVRRSNKTKTTYCDTSSGMVNYLHCGVVPAMHIK